MKTNQVLDTLQNLLTRPYFTSKEAKKLGVSPSSLCYYVKIGKLSRISRGVYQSTDFQGSVSFQWEDLIEAVYSVSGGVICLISALSIYNLTEEMPRQHWIAIPNTTTAKERPQTRILRYRNMTIGRTEIELGGARIPIFDRERCIIDAFRLLSRETALKALKTALSYSKSSVDTQYPFQEKIDLVKLQNYAKKLRVNIIPYLIAMTT